MSELTLMKKTKCAWIGYSHPEDSSSFGLLFMVFGWLLPGKDVLKVHIAFVPLVIIQWQLNNGTCLLTNAENLLSREKRDRNQQQGQFIKGVLGRFMKELPTDSQIKILVYALILGAAGFSTFRLLAW